MSSSTSGSTEVIGSKPIASRIPAFVLGLVLAALFIYLIVAQWPIDDVARKHAAQYLTRKPAMFVTRLFNNYALNDRDKMDYVGQFRGVLLSTLFLIPMALAFYAAGAAFLAVNVGAGTYRFRRGFPLLARSRTGPLGDIAAIYVKSIPNRPNCTISAAWKGRGGGLFTLGNGRPDRRRDIDLETLPDREAAVARARALAERLGVPYAENGEEFLQRGQRIRQQQQNLFGIIGGLYFVIAFGFPTLYIDHELHGRGLRGSAVIIPEKGQRGSATRARYAFILGTRIFMNINTVNPDSYRHVMEKAKGQVPVLYLPEHPRTSRIVISTDNFQAYIAVVFGGLIFILSLIPFFVREKPVGSEGGSD